jgi:hypothetical protein
VAPQGTKRGEDMTAGKFRIHGFVVMLNQGLKPLISAVICGTTEVVP